MKEKVYASVNTDTIYQERTGSGQAVFCCDKFVYIIYIQEIPGSVVALGYSP